MALLGPLLLVACAIVTMVFLDQVAKAADRRTYTGKALRRLYIAVAVVGIVTGLGTTYIAHELITQHLNLTIQARRG